MYVFEYTEAAIVRLFATGGLGTATTRRKHGCPPLADNVFTFLGPEMLWGLLWTDFPERKRSMEGKRLFLLGQHALRTHSHAAHGDRRRANVT